MNLPELFTEYGPVFLASLIGSGVGIALFKLGYLLGHVAGLKEGIKRPLRSCALKSLEQPHTKGLINGSRRN